MTGHLSRGVFTFALLNNFNKIWGEKKAEGRVGLLKERTIWRSQGGDADAQYEQRVKLLSKIYSVLEDSKAGCVQVQDPCA